MLGAERYRLALYLVPMVLMGLCAVPASAFQLHNNLGRWTSTAASGGGLVQGDPTVITWSIVPDGRTITGSEGTSPSTLRAELDSRFGSMDVWFPLFESSFNRWGEISGLTFQYESNDSPSAINGSQSPTGVLGSVADVRIGGHSIDGTTGSTNTLAYSYFPNHSDMVIDTDDLDGFLGISNGNFLRLRNTLMHELGHGLGIEHVQSTAGAFLLEGSISVGFTGPQLDDILAIQRLYGDAWEKNGGNNSAATATSLGNLASSPSIGTLGDTLAVSILQTDFISIDGSSDVDYFSFTIDAPAVLSASLTPKGVSYDQGPPGGSITTYNSKAQSDLRLEIYDRNGTSLLASANNTGVGFSEFVNDLLLPNAGTYYARVAGGANNVQLYQLDLSGEDYLMPGDVNLDGFLTTGSGDPATDDVAAFIASWRTVLPTDDDVTAWSKGDLDLNRVSDLNDWLLLRDAFAAAQMSSQFLAAAAFSPATWAVPEPAAGLLLASSLLAVTLLRRKGRAG